MCTWSIVACSQSRLTGESSFYATRSLMGLIEGGFIPDVVLYLSYFYKGKELPVRLAFFWSSFIMTNIVSAFLAYGILHMRGISGWAGWRWMFALEGGVTAIIGIMSWFYLPPSPTETASWFRGKDGWFSEREEKIMVNRILRDDPGKVCLYRMFFMTTLTKAVDNAQSSGFDAKAPMGGHEGLRSMAHLPLWSHVVDSHDSDHRLHYSQPQITRL